MRKPLTSWQVMSSILKPNIKPTVEEIKTINSFFFCRYLGSNKHSVPIAGALNRIYNIPIEAQFIFAQDYSDLVDLPRFVKFINYQKEKVSPDMEKILSNIEKKYKISREHAQTYFDLMLLTDEGKQQLSIIMEMYDVGLQK